MCQEGGGDKDSGFFLSGVVDLWGVGVNVSVVSSDRMVDVVEQKKECFGVSVIFVRASCVDEVCIVEFGKKFKSWSMAVICVLKRFGSDKISVFVGTVSGIMACIAVVARFVA